MDDKTEVPLNDQARLKPTPLIGSCRLNIAIVSFFGFCNLYLQRINMSVAIVCMINHTAVHESQIIQDIHIVNYTGHQFETGNRSEIKKLRSCDELHTDAFDSNNSISGEFVWHKSTQGLILGSFFWGYLCTQIFGGWLSIRCGGKRVYGWFMLACSILTLLTPVAARTHVFGLIGIRCLIGLCQGVVFPAQQSLWSYWAPPLETSLLPSIGYAGTMFGTIINFPLAAYLCECGFDGGWPSIFYVFGSIGIVWFLTWMYFVYDKPDEHPRISEKEKKFIVQSTEHKMSNNRKSIPWLNILTSIRVWAIIVAHTCENWACYTFLTTMPIYFKEVLNFDIQKNGLLSALPYIGIWTTMTITGCVVDKIRKRRILSTTCIRKICVSLGCFLPVVFLMATAHVDCNHPITAAVLLTLCITFSGCDYGGGFIMNPSDIAPSYAGIIFGISNTIATIPGFLSPLVVVALTPNRSSLEWRKVFYVACVMYIFGALFFNIFASGELQSWAKSKKTDTNIVIEKPGNNTKESDDTKSSIVENSIL